jgi:hypothetical protein
MVTNNVRKKFNSLPFEHRAHIITGTDCKHIHRTVNDHLVIFLYVLNNDLIEVVFNTRLRKTVDIYMPDYNELDIHLININLTKLI